MEKSLQPRSGQELLDNEILFSTDGHLTDEGLEALCESRLDELGSLEAAEHLTFCDYCLARYTALLDTMREKLQSPMRDLIPQVQALMRLRSFRVMTNRYVSVAAAVALALTLWGFGAFGHAVPAAQEPAAPQAPRISISQTLGEAFGTAGRGLNSLFSGMQSSFRSGLAQISDNSILNNGGHAAGGE